jgi:arylsulfatase A-like enzyme
MIRKLKILSFGILICASSCGPKLQKQANNSKPNLLFIFGDQHRRQAMGFVNEDPVLTPHLDRLANEGVYFSKAVANHPLCSPYRAMVMTGQYPLNNGVIANCHSRRTEYNNYLDKNNTSTFSDVLAKNNYNAGYVGKWHLEGPVKTPEGDPIIWDAWCPFDRRHGFDFWYAYNADNDHFKPHYWKTNAEEGEAIYIDQWSPEHEAEVIMEYIDGGGHAPRDKNKPFALFWSINPPHTPFSKVPDRYKKMYEGETARSLLNRPNVSFTDNTTIKVGDHGVSKQIEQAPFYFASVTGVDDQIGRVINKLKEKGIYENTIIVYSADHGEMLGSQGLMHKNVWFKESFEIPLIVHWSKKIKPTIEELLISVPDYMPTLLSLMGLEREIPKNIDGVNYADALFGKTIERPKSQLYFGSEPSNPSSGKRGYRDMEHTFAVVKYNNDIDKSYYLYDDLNDPYQLNNIWGEDPERDAKVHAKLTNLLRKMSDPWLDE